MEERSAHTNDLILDHPQRIEDYWIQCVRVDILHKTCLSELTVLLGMLVNISKGLSFGGIHISLYSFIEQL